MLCRLVCPVGRILCFHGTGAQSCYLPLNGFFEVLIPTIAHQLFCEPSRSRCMSDGDVLKATLSMDAVRIEGYVDESHLRRAPRAEKVRAGHGTQLLLVPFQGLACRRRIVFAFWKGQQ